MLSNYVFLAWDDPRYKAKLHNEELEKNSHTMNTTKYRNAEATTAGKWQRSAGKLACFSFSMYYQWK